jgi:dihydroneopterin aldolase
VMSVPTHLIEHLARNIVNGLVEKAGKSYHYRVRVRKHQPPLGGSVACTYIELDS